MATGKRFYWIKLKESFMSSDTVDYLMSLPNGANYVVLYQILCLKTINTEGRLSRQIGEIIIPYDVEKIERDCKWFSTDTIRIALGLYKNLGLIYEDKDGTLVLTDHDNLVGSETDYAEKNRRMRAAQNAALPSGGGHIVSSDVSDDVSQNVSIDIRDKEYRDKDNRYSINNIITNTTDATPQAEEEKSRCPFTDIQNLYNSICISYPKIKSIDGNRKTAVAARWRKYKDIDTFKELFKIAEQSDFLKGQNDRNWNADFDWLMKPTNIAKVLEHKYDNRRGITQQAGALGVLEKMRREMGE